MRLVGSCDDCCIRRRHRHRRAEERPVELKPGPGLDKVEGHCGACHSLDYIQINSPFLNAAGWNAEVTKMIKAFGAPIDAADAKAIVDYLAKNYGP